MDLSKKDLVEDLVKQKNNADQIKLERMANFQTNVIFFETFCGFSIFFHPKRNFEYFDGKSSNNYLNLILSRSQAGFFL